MTIDKLKKVIERYPGSWDQEWYGVVSEVIRQHEAEQPQDVVEAVADAICHTARKAYYRDNWREQAKASIAAMEKSI